MAKVPPDLISWSSVKEIYQIIDRESSHQLELPTAVPDWLEWLATHNTFTFQGKNGRLNLQKESRPRSKEGYWYAYQRQGKGMVKQYLGRSSSLNLERLEDAAQNLTAKVQTAPDNSTIPQAKISETHLLSAPDTLNTNRTEIALLTKTYPTTTLVLQSAEPLLEPKLRVPRLRRSLVVRERLLERLDEGLTHKLTLILAPAGFGKTTLVRHWLADRYEVYPVAKGVIPKIAWVSLDEGDNDPVRFWRYIIMACQLGGLVNEQTALEELISPPQPPYHPIGLQSGLIAFLNELTPVTGLNILVLEDYHVITSAQLHETLSFFLENLPANLHLIITSRYEPPLPLARLRGQGELNELHYPDLRFSVQEANDFLQANNSYSFSEEMVQQLDHHLEGWAAGLRLFTLALQSSKNQAEVEHFLKTFTGSHRSIQDYFVTEVLNILPPPLQEFVLQTSILERLTPSLCNAITGKTNSDKLLENLERANLFLEALDGSGEWYRYHALFAEAMRQESGQRFGSATLVELYKRASYWFEQHDLLPDAIEAALKAKDFAQAAQLIEMVINTNQILVGLQFFRELSEFYTLSRWFKALPSQILRQRPALSLNYAATLILIALVEMSVVPPPIIAQIQEALDWASAVWEGENQRGKLAQVFAFRALLAHGKGDIKEAIEWAAQALKWLPKQERPWRGMVLTVLGFYEIYNGQLEQAKRFINEARLNSEAQSNRNLSRANVGLLGWVYSEQGELHQAAEYTGRVLAEARDVYDIDDITLSLFGLARLSYEWNDLETAWQQSQEVLDLISPLSAKQTWTQASLLQVQILYAHGQTIEALQRLNSLLSGLPPPDSVVAYQHYREVRLLQARLYLETEQLTGFERWLETLSSVEAGAETTEFEVFQLQRVPETLLLTRWLVGRGEWNKALVLLEPLLAEMQSVGRFRYAMRIRLNMAMALLVGKKPREAGQQLQIVLSQAHVEGFVRLFLDEGEALANLLRANTLPTGSKALNLYRQKILQAFDQVQPPKLIMPTRETLSTQEQRVLALLNAGLSYPEIARQLVVSVNTIKTQVKSIYQKLNVNNRHQAQETARQLNLL